MTKTILQIGNPQSPLNYGMGTAAQNEEQQIHWYSHVVGNIPGVRHHTLPNWIARSYVLRAIFEPFYLAHIIQKVDPDLIQVHYASKGLAAIPIIRAKALLVSAMGSDIASNIGYRFPYRFWIDLLLKKADAITTRSKFMEERLLQIGVQKEKIKIIYWGIDLDHFSRKGRQKELKEKWGADPEAFVFFDPRSTDPLYNKDIIIRSFAELSKTTDKKVNLLVAAIFASKEEMSKLKLMVSDLNIKDNVRFLGSIDYEDMPELYSLAECTVSVPSSDGMPQTIFEAWGCGSFLIVGDLPQYNEFIEDGVTAKRVKIRDVDSLANAMQWLMNEDQLREKAIDLGRKRAMYFADRKVQKKAMSDLVGKLIAESGNE